MTVEQFANLQGEKKQQLMFSNGVYLVTRQEPEYIIDLYQIESFYIEAYYHKSSKNLVYVKGFTNMDELKPYLRHIDITSLSF